MCLESGCGGDSVSSGGAERRRAGRLPLGCREETSVARSGGGIEDVGERRLQRRSRRGGGAKRNPLKLALAGGLRFAPPTLCCQESLASAGLTWPLKTPDAARRRPPSSPGGLSE